jgi:hypothetical protein
MKFAKSLLPVFLSIAFIAAACAPGAPTLSDSDQIATLVAATLNAQQPDEGSPEIEPPTGEAGGVQPPIACANTGSLSVAYIKNGDAWLWVQGSAPTALTAAGDLGELRISDDGCLVAFTRALPNPGYDPNSEFPQADTFNELWVIASDGSALTQLVSQQFLAELPKPEDVNLLSVYQFDWQPGGHQLAFNTQLVIGFGLALSNDIHLVDASSAQITTLLPGGQGGDFVFSPNGQRMAFAQPESISVVNVDGSDLRQDVLTFPLVITYSEYLYYPTPSWSTSNNELMVAIPPEDGLAEPLNGVYPETALWYLPLDGTDPIWAGAVQSVWLAQQDMMFSPDNSRVAYLRPVGAPEYNQQELVLALSNGSNEYALVSNSENFGAWIHLGDWSSDSQRHLYWTSQGGVKLWLLDLAGVSTPIPYPGGEAVAGVSVDWLYDAYVLVFLQQSGAPEGGSGDLYLLNVDSGESELIDTLTGFFAVFDSAAP